jgi:hypothetical protein
MDSAIKEELTQWLDAWDSGCLVPTIEMGGFGPGYEQAIQITTAELLRHMLSTNYDSSKWLIPNTDSWKEDDEALRTFGHSSTLIKTLGLSGAQWGVALNLATMFYIRGVSAVMNDDRVADRYVMMSKGFPSVG